MPRRVHLLSPDHGGLPRRRHHTPPVTATRATAAVWTARVDASELALPPPETSISRFSHWTTNTPSSVMMRKIALATAP